MSIEQVNVDILGRQFNIGTPNSEKATLLQAVHMLNQKIGVIQSSGRIVETDKIVIMAALNLTHDLAENRPAELRRQAKAHNGCCRRMENPPPATAVFQVAFWISGSLLDFR